MYTPQTEVCTVIRFVSGGHELITSVVFSDAPGRIALKKSFLCVISILRGIFMRTAYDWGWLAHLNLQFGVLCSFDRKRGYQSYRGPVLPDGRERRHVIVRYISSPLAQIPVYGVYTVAEKERHEGSHF